MKDIIRLETLENFGRIVTPRDGGDMDAGFPGGFDIAGLIADIEDIFGAVSGLADEFLEAVIFAPKTRRGQNKIKQIDVLSFEKFVDVF